MASLEEVKAEVKNVKALLGISEMNDFEFSAFINYCKSLGLSPERKQIYAIKRWDSVRGTNSWTYQTSIDGMRAIAESSAEYRGQSAPQWCGDDGIWCDVWLGKTPPAAARVSIYRAGFEHPVTSVAKYSSYVQTSKDGRPTKFWAQMPDVMLSKVAESLALRKAFPSKISALYTDDEMGQADNQQAFSGKTLELMSAELNDMLEAARAQGITEARLESRVGKKIREFSASDIVDVMRVLSERQAKLSASV